MPPCCTAPVICVSAHTQLLTLARIKFSLLCQRWVYAAAMCTT